ncbi:MAG TPA: IS21 family transposase, partial [Kofleriaceae bacterium]|nr:IS21 family transposase [Kofleriaceae bacterium]
MANVLSEDKRQKVEALGRLGWSLRRIEREARVRRETASAYLKAAGIEVRGRGGGKPKPATSAELITDPAASKPATSAEVIIDSPTPKPASCAEVITDSAPGTPSTASSCEPYRDLITPGIEDGRTAMSISQELVEKRGFTARYAAVNRFVRKVQRVTSPEARVVIETRAGEEAQVDYGEGPMVRDPTSGKYRRVRLFLLALAHSRKTVRLLTWRSSTKIWAQLHEQAFRRLGGVTAIVVLDNLREGVLAPDVYDPLLNPLYRDVLAHYGSVALPCRVRDPDRKGKVESGIHHTQRALRGLRFESLEEAQTWLDNWDARWADTRIHGTTKRQVAAMFADER